MRIRFIIILLILASCTPRLIPIPDPTQIELTSLPLEESKPSPMSTIDISKISANVTLYPVETPPILEISMSALPETTPIFDLFTEGFIVKAKNDLNQQTGIELEKITVLSIESVEWPDGSLGCGKPGTEYLQVVTPGFLIVLEVNGQIYTYHTDMSSQIVLCSEKLPIRLSPAP